MHTPIKQKDRSSRFFTDFEEMLDFTIGLIRRGKTFINKGHANGWTVEY